MGKSIRHIRVKKVEGLYCLCEIKNLTAQLICAFVFAYLKYRFYHVAANWLIYHVRNKIYVDMGNDFQFCNTIMLLKIHDAHSKP